MREVVLGSNGVGFCSGSGTKKVKSENGCDDDEVVLVPPPPPVVVGRGRSQPGSRRVAPAMDVEDTTTAGIRNAKAEDPDCRDGDVVPAAGFRRTRSQQGPRLIACATISKDPREDKGCDAVLVQPSCAVVLGLDHHSRRRRVIPTSDVTTTADSQCEDLIMAPSEPWTVEKVLPNGDLYTGTFFANVPHGTGKYLWADGCMYEGEWRRGRATGNGKFSWPSGATYEGEFKGGRMDGFGTFIGTDGDTYKGSWAGDRKHGHGEKRYVNGDVYVGSWKWNLQHGEGRYVWNNGTEYAGEWKNGVMCGKGVLIWADGKRYEGDWADGMPKGTGVFTWPDGSCYAGSFGGEFSDHLLFTRRKRSSVDGGRSSLGDRIENGCINGNGNVIVPRICIWDSDGEAGDITCDIVDNVEASMLYRDGSDFGCGEAEEVVRSPCRVDGGEVKKPGQMIFKGHKNYQLMLHLQLGVSYSTGKYAFITRELGHSDFDPKKKFWTRFPPEGSKCTPPHQSIDFKWKDYCPMVFRHLRELFAIDPAEYMLAVCGNDAIREFSSPGKSGSLFYLTQGDRFMIKTIKKSEVKYLYTRKILNFEICYYIADCEGTKVLIRMLPSYYEHIYEHKNSLVTKFLGLHCVKPAGGQKMRFVVMSNLFYSDFEIHKRFDLKGSSHGRSTYKPEGEIDETTTLKDLDLNFVFHLQQSWFEDLMSQIDVDCEFLEAERIMDYSLLVGVHFRNDCFDNEMNMPAFNMHADEKIRKGSGGLILKADAQDMDWILEGGKPRIRLGANMPARAMRMSRIKFDNSMPPLNGTEIFDVVLYFGIIDILQDYDIGKKLEHAYKSLQVDPTSISAVDPKLYSKRFRGFIRRIFVVDDE